MNKNELIKVLKSMCDAEEIRLRSLEIQSSVEHQYDSSRIRLSINPGQQLSDEQLIRTQRVNEHNNEFRSKLLPLRSYISERVEKISESRNNIFEEVGIGIPEEYKSYGPMSVFLGYLQSGICTTLEDCINKYNYDKAINAVYAETLYDNYGEDETNKYVPDTIISFRNSIANLEERIKMFEKGFSDSKTVAAQTGVLDFQKLNDYGDFLIELIGKEIKKMLSLMDSIIEEEDAKQYIQPDSSYTPVASSGKSKTVAGILGILLGSCGAHKFYMGKIGLGIIYLLFCWTYIPSIVGLIEGIMYLTESEEKFESRMQ